MLPVFTCASAIGNLWSICLGFNILRSFPNLDCSVTVFWSEGNICYLVRYSYLWIFPENNADIFAAAPLRSHSNISTLIVSSIAMISFYTLSEKFSLKLKELSDVRVASITKKEYDFAVHLL